jgi:plastocyanin
MVGGRMACRGLSRGVAFALLGFAAFVQPAAAADYPVRVSSDVFTPSTVTINVSDSVTWSNTGGEHNVHFDDESYMEPPAPSTELWTVSRTFDEPATLRYYCEVHGAQGGVGMSGTVVVLLAGAPPPGAGQPGAGGSPADKVAPTITVATRSRQRLAGRRAASLTVRSNEAGTATVTGRLSVPGASRTFRLRKVTAKLIGNVERKLTVRLSRGQLSATERALRRGSRPTLRLTISVADAAGNVRSVKRTVRLRK